eukprot:EG_transcript_24971
MQLPGGRPWWSSEDRPPPSRPKSCYALDCPATPLPPHYCDWSAEDDSPPPARRAKSRKVQFAAAPTDIPDPGRSPPRTHCPIPPLPTATHYPIPQFPRPEGTVTLLPRPKGPVRDTESAWVLASPPPTIDSARASRPWVRRQPPSRTRWCAEEEEEEEERRRSTALPGAWGWGAEAGRPPTPPPNPFAAPPPPQARAQLSPDRIAVPDRWPAPEPPAPQSQPPLTPPPPAAQPSTFKPIWKTPPAVTAA